MSSKMSTELWNKTVTDFQLLCYGLLRVYEDFWFNIFEALKVKAENRISYGV